MSDPPWRAMRGDCYPLTMFPGVSRLYAAYLEWGDRGSQGDPSVGKWYAARPGALEWTRQENRSFDPAGLVQAILASPEAAHYGQQTMRNIERLGAGARTVVTGQQAGLFGGPLLTLLKAATAIARAQQAEAATGVPHVPVFWVATEDHDLQEVNQATFAGKDALQTLRLDGIEPSGGEVGTTSLTTQVQVLLDVAKDLLQYAPVTEILEHSYGASEATFGSAFTSWMIRLFAPFGLIVLDASSRDFHRLGSSTLRYALEHAQELETHLLARTAALEAEGFHAQVLVKPGSSLLFLIQGTRRVGLRQTGEGIWKAGSQTYSTSELLSLLEAEPERFSPNALLRPVFQDTILPVAAYIGGPAEIAYFAQSEVLYRAILGRVTPVLPRFSATLVSPAVLKILAHQELAFPVIVESATANDLAQRLAARAMPIEAKRRIAVTGTVLKEELEGLTDYLKSLDAGLGRSAEVAANKMRYQMNRLRRMSASFQLQKDGALRKQANTVMLNLFPGGHAQERVLAGVQFLAQAGENYPALVALLVEEAASTCPGHVLLEF